MGINDIVSNGDDELNKIIFCTIYCDNTVLQNKSVMTTNATLMVTLNCYSPKITILTKLACQQINKQGWFEHALFYIPTNSTRF